MPHVSLQGELNAFTPAGTEVVRAGPVFTHALPGGGTLAWRLFPRDTARTAQVSWVVTMPLRERLTLVGFADLNLDWDQGRPLWIAEAEFTYHLKEAST